MSCQLTAGLVETQSASDSGRGGNGRVLPEFAFPLARRLGSRVPKDGASGELSGATSAKKDPQGFSPQRRGKRDPRRIILVWWASSDYVQGCGLWEVGRGEDGWDLVCCLAQEGSKQDQPASFSATRCCTFAAREQLKGGVSLPLVALDYYYFFFWASLNRLCCSSSHIRREEGPSNFHLGKERKKKEHQKETEQNTTTIPYFSLSTPPLILRRENKNNQKILPVESNHHR